MATKQKKNTTKKKVASTPSPFTSAKNTVCTFKKENKLLFVVIIISIILLSAFLVWQLLIWREKQQFNNAEAALDSLTADITAAIGAPQSIEKDKYCSYKSEKYTTLGNTPNCLVSYDISYNNSPESGEDFAKNIDEIIANQSSNIEAKSLYESYNHSRLYSYEPTSQSPLKIDSVPLSCFIVFKDDRSFNDSVKIRLSCSGDSLSEHYIVKE